MGYKNFNREFEIDEEKAAEFLGNAVDRIMTEEDIDTLVDAAVHDDRYYDPHDEERQKQADVDAADLCDAVCDLQGP